MLRTQTSWVAIQPATSTRPSTRSRTGNLRVGQSCEDLDQMRSQSSSRFLAYAVFFQFLPLVLNLLVPFRFVRA